MRGAAHSYIGRYCCCCRRVGSSWSGKSLPAPSLPSPFPSLPLPLPPLEEGRLKYSYEVWGSAVSPPPRWIWSAAPAEIEFGEF